MSSTALRWTISRSPDATTIAMAGEIDMATESDVDDAVGVAEGPEVIVDLSEVTFVDSRGIAAFLRAQRELERRGASLVIRGAQPQVRRVLEVTQMDTVLHVTE